MGRFLTASALGLGLLWSWTAQADCVSEMQCDSAGVCMQVEVCEDAVGLVRI